MSNENIGEYPDPIGLTVLQQMATMQRQLDQQNVRSAIMEIVQNFIC